MINELKKGKECIGQQVIDTDGNAGIITDFFVENGKKSKVVIIYPDGTTQTREKYAVQQGKFRKPFYDDIDNKIKSGDWKYIPGFQNRYIISKYGEIQSAFGVNKGKILAPAIDNNGYYIIVLQASQGRNGRRLCRVHRLVATTFLGFIDPEDEINHIDGNKQNNKLANLEIISKKANNKKYLDLIELGLTQKEIDDITEYCIKNNITIKEYILYKLRS